MAVYGNIENIDAIVLANVEAGARHIDGFSPIVETEQTATGEHITITDKEAVHEFDIRNGSAMAARVEDETAVFTTDGAQYQPVEISDEGEHFESDTVEGALNELAEATANIASDVADLQDALETEQTAVRSVALGGTGADNAEEAIENLGIADYVVESGFSNNWRYQKWNSGKAELWYFGSVTTSGNAHYSDSTLYYSDEVFLTTPFKIANGVVAGSCARAGEYISNVGSSWENQRISFRIYRNDGVALGSNVQLHIHVMGDWK